MYRENCWTHVGHALPVETEMGAEDVRNAFEADNMEANTNLLPVWLHNSNFPAPTEREVQAFSDARAIEGIDAIGSAFLALLQLFPGGVLREEDRLCDAMKSTSMSSDTLPVPVPVPDTSLLKLLNLIHFIMDQCDM